MAFGCVGKRKSVTAQIHIESSLVHSKVVVDPSTISSTRKVKIAQTNLAIGCSKKLSSNHLKA